MRIQNIAPSCYCVPAKKSEKKEISLASDTPQECERMVRVFDPAKRIQEEREYQNKLYDTYFETLTDETGKTKFRLEPEIKEYMDNKIFEFEGPEGEKIKGSAKDALKAYVASQEDIPCIDGALHGALREAIESIIKNGFDTRRISATAFGPGFYFGSEGTAQDYSSAKLQADIKRTKRPDGSEGKFVRFNQAYYNDMICCKLYGAMNDVLRLDTGYSKVYNPFSTDFNDVNRNFLSKAINEYCRDILVNEMGIDAAFAASPGYHNCVVVFNPDAIANVKEFEPYGDSYNGFLNY